MHSAKSLIFYY